MKRFTHGAVLLAGLGAGFSIALLKKDDPVSYMEVIVLAASVIGVSVGWYNHFSLKRKLLAALKPGISTRPTAPRAAEFLLYLILDKADREYLIGDLAEEFATIILPKFGLQPSKIWYWKQVLSSIPPTFWKALRRIATIGTIAEVIRRFFRWM